MGTIGLTYDINGMMEVIKGKSYHEDISGQSALAWYVMMLINLGRLDILYSVGITVEKL